MWFPSLALRLPSTKQSALYVVLFSLIAPPIMLSVHALQGDVRAHATAAFSSEPPASSAHVDDAPATMADRIAVRLQSRLGGKGTIAQLAKAVRTRQTLLRQSLTLQFQTHTGALLQSSVISPGADPLLIAADTSAWLSANMFTLNEEHLSQVLQAAVESVTVQPHHAHLTAYEGAPRHAVVEGVASDGRSFETKGLLRSALAALQDGSAITLAATIVPGVVTADASLNMPTLTALATGQSVFHTSPVARKENVRKALREKINGTVVLPGETYSFVSGLGGKISTGNGWYMAKVIKKKKLEYEPGGGICQASTTLYRALVYAGLPVQERRAHTMYVTYYRDYGVGLDATIYPGTQDLSFVNDTGNPIYIQATADENDIARVTLYGVPDGRSVALQGPLFDSSQAGELQDGKEIARNEIAWVQEVTLANGERKTNVIRSRYDGVPKSLKTAEIPTTTLHAAAPAVATSRELSVLPAAL